MIRSLRLSVVLMGGIAGMTVGARAFGQLVLQSSNPFAEYADFFPGSSADRLQNSSFICRDSDDYRDYLQRQCHYNPPDGAFHTILVLIDTQRIIRTTFILRDASVRVGDFTVWWETHPVPGPGNAVIYDLSDSVFIAQTAVHPEHSFLLDTVSSVSFTAKDAIQ
jgi:hypothetical protein